MKKLIAAAVTCLCLAAIAPAPALAAKNAPALNIFVDISNQSMTVQENGWRSYSWRVSTARDGYWTPRGKFRPFSLRKVYFSRKYDNAPMPHSVFFHGGYAIHATNYVKSLGRPASHGCIRLSPSNAARLYSLVQRYGMGSTRITIVE